MHSRSTGGGSGIRVRRAGRGQNLTIRDQLADDLNVTSLESFYRRTGSLLDLHSGPFRAVLDSDANLGDTEDAHFVVTNIRQLAQRIDRWLPDFPSDFFDMIIVDEGHHNAAPTWQAVFERFPDAKVISLTATPFAASSNSETPSRARIRRCGCRCNHKNIASSSAGASTSKPDPSPEGSANPSNRHPGACSSPHSAVQVPRTTSPPSSYCYTERSTRPSASNLDRGRELTMEELEQIEPQLETLADTVEADLREQLH